MWRQIVQYPGFFGGKGTKCSGWLTETTKTVKKKQWSIFEHPLCASERVNVRPTLFWCRITVLQGIGESHFTDRRQDATARR
jgi:hypothetical protein